MEREPTAEEREKTGSAIGGLQSGGREWEGGVGKCSRHRRVVPIPRPRS
jgi:hypothetical protein